MNTPLIMFLAFVGLTLLITFWAAKKNTGASAYFAAGRSITGWQNGLAVAGDYMSAASFLGISGMIYVAGYDGFMYSVGFLVAYITVLLIVAEPLRNAGKYTMADLLAYRLKPRPVRALASLSTLVVSTFYMIAQMVGAGAIIKQLINIDFEPAVIGVGLLMLVYVVFGGMLATTWVQIIKAVLLLFGASLIALLVLAHFNFSLGDFFQTAVDVHSKGNAIMEPGTLVSDPVSAISLGLALMFGTAGLPHILMRFFTVRDAVQARRSVMYATGFIGYFYILTFIIGFGAIVLVSTDATYLTGGKLIGGDNMAAVHLAHAVGGNVLLGFMSAVAFATILAVVSGLTLAGASAISHDLYANVFAKGAHDEKKEMRVSKIATVVLGVLAIGLGILFEQQNVAFMVGLAFAIAASANFPILVLSMYWRKLTTRGALIGGAAGLLTAIVMVVLSSVVWVDVFGNAEPIFPYKYPAIFSMPVAFIGICLFSVLDRSPAAAEARAKFDAQYIRAQTGIGIDKAVQH